MKNKTETESENEKKATGGKQNEEERKIALQDRCGSLLVFCVAV